MPNETSSLEDQIRQARGDAAALEHLYRKSQAEEREQVFADAMVHCLEDFQDDVLLQAWAYRLRIRSLSAEADENRSGEHRRAVYWLTAIAYSVLLGAMFAVFARNKPPVPIPGEADPLFWIGWGPLTAIGVLLFLATVDYASGRIQHYLVAAALVSLIAVVAALITWEKSDHQATLIALHLPFLAWGCVAASVTLGRSNVATQFYGALVKSAETALTGGVFFGGALVFGGLTYGIFSVLSIKFSEDFVRFVAAFGIGAIPILSLASVYDPTRLPAQQKWETGLSRVLKILTRLMLPLALGVLAVYLFWFIPIYFWRPFEEREVLIVYNASIMAVLALLASTVTGSDKRQSGREETALRFGIMSLSILTLVLNVYALAAIVSRTFTFGLTPNRQAVLGWNTITMVMIVVALVRLLRASDADWIDSFRESIALLMPPAFFWALWLTFALPYF